MSIDISWWALPLVITVAVMMWAIMKPAEYSGDYSFDVLPIFRMFIAVIVSLASWLIWSLTQ